MIKFNAEKANFKALNLLEDVQSDLKRVHFDLKDVQFDILLENTASKIDNFLAVVA